MATDRGEKIRRFIVGNVDEFPADIAARTAKKFDISRQAVNKHLQRLVSDGALTVEGETRSRRYRLAALGEWKRLYRLESSLSEDRVWQADVAVALGELPGNVRNIWQHGFTEMFNNAIDHSEGRSALVRVTRTAAFTEMTITDNGIGIFKKIQSVLRLADEQDAALQLVKGKLTTDPTRHSGEGIFFTSRMFDQFSIDSGGATFEHTLEDDWVWDFTEPVKGTVVFMKLDNHTARTAKTVFDEFSSGDDYAFNKTIVPVRLARFGTDQLVSRSQAKRVLTRIELFKTAMFDFKDVPSIGQAFADEIFRVFARQHPDVKVVAVNASSDVQKMIARARSASVS